MVPVIPIAPTAVVLTVSQARQEVIGENIDFAHGSSRIVVTRTRNHRTRMAVTTTNLSNLGFVARGKVRDIYSFPEDDKSLLFVATDRVPPPSVPSPTPSPFRCPSVILMLILNPLRYRTETVSRY